MGGCLREVSLDLSRAFTVTPWLSGVMVDGFSTSFLYAWMRGVSVVAENVVIRLSLPAFDWHFTPLPREDYNPALKSLVSTFMS